jgi:hypothetical protein
MIYADQLDYLLLHSSRVGVEAITESRTFVRLDTWNPTEPFDLNKAELERVTNTTIEVVPQENSQNRKGLDLTTLKVVLVPATRSRGKCLWNSTENILFFADEMQLQQQARDFGFCPVFFTAFIVEVGEAVETEEVEMPLATIIPFPIQPSLPTAYVGPSYGKRIAMGGMMQLGP